MKKYYSLFFIICLLSCSSPERKTLEIDFEGFSEKEITLAGIADDIAYIQLDNSLPMSFVYRMEILNDTIYLDEKENGLMALDMSGHIIRHYGQRGRGPGEYVYGLRFTIDPLSRTIFLLDQNNLIKYSLNGFFLGKIPLKEYQGSFREIVYKDSRIYAFEYIMCGKAKNNWIVLDTLGNLIVRKLNYIPSFETYLTGTGGIYLFNDNISSWDIFNDTVFSIMPDLTYSAAILFTNNKLRFPGSVIGVEEYKNYVTPSLLFETNKYVVLAYAKDKSYLVFIDKERNESYRATGEGKYQGLRNDLDCGVAFVPKQHYKYKDREYIAGYTLPSEIIKRVNSDDFKSAISDHPEKKYALTMLAKELKETDNAMLTIVRLKKTE